MSTTIGRLMVFFHSCPSEPEDEGKRLLPLDRAATRLGALIPPSDWDDERMIYTAYFEEIEEPPLAQLSELCREIETIPGYEIPGSGWEWEEVLRERRG